MNDNHIDAILKKREKLNEKIHAEEKRPKPDEVTIHQLKAERLRLKEELNNCTKH